MSEIRAQTKRIGYSIEDVFGDIDVKETGKITFLQFRKAISNLNIWIDDQSFTAIAKKFSHEQGYFDYKEFLDEYNEDGLILTSKIDTEIVGKFGSDLATRGISLIDVLSPFDKHNSGLVSALVLKSNISSKYMDKIIEMYTLQPNNEIRYIDLQNQINKLTEMKETTKKELTASITIESLKESKKIPDDLIPKMAKSMKIMGIDANSIFPMCDKYKQGTIPKELFIQEAVNFGLSLLPQEIFDIADAFSNEENRFDYVSFIEIINNEQEEAEQNIQTQRAKEIENAKQKVPSVEETCNKIQEIASNRRAQIRGFYENFDPFMTGKIGKKIFKKILSFEGYPVSQAELDQLADEYETDDGKIDYNKFADRIEKKPKPITEDLEKITTLLRDHLEHKQIDIKPMCLKYDKTNEGIILFEQFLTIMRDVQFHFDNKEQSLLKIKFAEKDGTINIEKLLDAVNPVIVPPKEEEEQLPLATQTREEPTEEEKEALARMAAIIDKNNVDIRNECKTMSSNNFGTMKASQFNSVMLRIGDVPKEDIEIFLKRYEGKAPYEINFADFATDVENYGESTLKLNPSLNSTIIPVKEVSEEVIAIMKMIKAQLSTKGISVVDLFIPYDNRKLGVIPKSRAKYIFEVEKLNASSEQIEKLLETYEDQRAPTSCEYKRMCIDIENQTVTNDDLASFKIESLTMDNKLANVLSIVKEKLYSRRKRPEDIFKGITEPLISSSQFRTLCSEIGLVLREQEMQTIFKYCRTNMRGDIDWKSFCKQVDEMKY